LPLNRSNRSTLALLLACTPLLAQAQGHAHVHGHARLEVVIDGTQLAVTLMSPLDGIVGFEHAPRTAAQKQAAAAALASLKEGYRLFVLPAEAQCRPEGPASIEAPVLEGAAAQGGHADLEGRWSWRCAQPAQLKSMEQGLFSAFPRLSRIDVQVAGPQGQAKATLRKPAKAVKLVR
jgi:Protein of unknown function (DUF2796)